MNEEFRKNVLEEKMLPAFVESCVKAFETMAFMATTAGPPMSKESGLPRGQISGTIGVTGSIPLTGDTICGNVSLIFPDQVGQLIFRSMMMMEADEPVDDNELQDAVGELANMAAGGAKAAMQAMGLNFNISLPSVVVGSGHHLAQPGNAVSLVVPLKTELAEFFMQVTFVFS
jgi:chemotaxis protein CheX